MKSRSACILEPPPIEQSFLPAAMFWQQCVLICGDTAGIGCGIAEAFALAGANIALMGPASGSVATERLMQHDVQTTYIPCDSFNTTTIVKGFDLVEETLGPISILVNISRVESVFDHAALCCEEFARRSIQRGLHGIILSVGQSQNADDLGTMTQDYAKQWKGNNIRVTLFLRARFQMQTS